MLRVFLVADGRGDYRVMPGGLSRIAGADRQIVSGQRGGSSKDTWVLSDVAASCAAPSRRTPARPHRESLGERTTSSRAAENLFWLGRYAERSENGARLLRSVLGQPDRRRRVRGRAAPRVPSRVRAPALLVRPMPTKPPRPSAQTSDGVLARELLDGAVRSRRAPAAWASTSSRRSASPAPCAIGCRPTTGGSSTG